MGEVHDSVAVEMRFAIVPEWLIDSDVSATAKLVYSILARYAANSDGSSFPSRAAIAERAGVSKNTVSRALKELTDYRAIAVRPRFNGGQQTSNLYVVFQTDPANRGGYPPVGRGVPTSGEGGYPPVGTGTITSELKVFSNENTAREDHEAIFESIWDRWPKHTEKKRSRQEFVKAVKKHPSPEALAALVGKFGDAYREHVSPQYVPALAVWLRGERWTDDLPGPVGGKKPLERDPWAGKDVLR